MRFVVLALSIALLAAVPGSAISPYLVRDTSQVHQPIDSIADRCVYPRGRGRALVDRRHPGGYPPGQRYLSGDLLAARLRLQLARWSHSLRGE